MPQVLSAIQSNLLSVRADLAVHGSEIADPVVCRNLIRLADAFDDLCNWVDYLAEKVEGCGQSE